MFWFLDHSTNRTTTHPQRPHPLHIHVTCSSGRLDVGVSTILKKRARGSALCSRKTIRAACLGCILRDPPRSWGDCGVRQTVFRGCECAFIGGGARVREKHSCLCSRSQSNYSTYQVQYCTVDVSASHQQDTSIEPETHE